MGPCNDNKYLNECLQLVKEHQLTDKVIFMGLLPQEEVFKIYRKCKALLFFSEREGMPNTVLEAMAHNCVPIVSETDGVMSEVLEPNKSGFIISSIEKEISMPQIEEVIKTNRPYQVAMENHSIKNISYEYERLYQKMGLNFK
jgi:glycosyltransferase involved in cell wall biosynthesis